jgi:membrane-associated protease RseP (regulator of RpoE activity)
VGTYGTPRANGLRLLTIRRPVELGQEEEMTMKKISMVAAFALILIGVIGGLYAAGVFTGGGSSKAAAAASQVSSDQSAWLGVQIVQSTDGPTVASVIADSPAEKAGLKRGDVIKSIDGTSVSDVQAVRNALKDKKAGDTVTVSITRDGNAQDVTVTLEAQSEPLLQENPVLPELSGIPTDELFSHLLGGTFQFKDSDGKTHTVSVDLGTVASVDASAKTVSVDLNAGGSKKYTISDDVTAMPSDLTQFASGDQVTVVSVDGNLRALMKGPGLGGSFFGGIGGHSFGGMHGPGRGGWDGFQGENGGDGDFGMPRGEAGGGL